MKTIKFRIWNPEEKKMVESGATPMMLHSFFEYSARFNTQYEMPYQQFTGLTDKNGKEIYDGDIVEVKYSDGSGYDNPVEVSFENGSFWAGMGYLNDIKIIEVVGNIFQNPELLK